MQINAGSALKWWSCNVIGRTTEAYLVFWVTSLQCQLNWAELKWTLLNWVKVKVTGYQTPVSLTLSVAWPVVCFKMTMTLDDAGVNREKTCPLLLRMFYSSIKHNNVMEYQKGRTPSNELQVYTWWALANGCHFRHSISKSLKTYSRWMIVIPIICIRLSCILLYVLLTDIHIIRHYVVSVIYL